MATALAPVESREVVRCDLCLLVQFPARDNKCRRCHLSLDPPPPTPLTLAPPHEMTVAASVRLAGAVRASRLRAGLSQRQLAQRMGNVPRTYVSKIENEKATPTLLSLERLAAALGIRVGDLLTDDGAQAREAETRELAKDRFVAELLPFVRRLGDRQRRLVVAKVRDLAAVRSRRVALTSPAAFADSRTSVLSPPSWRQPRAWAARLRAHPPTFPPDSLSIHTSALSLAVLGFPRKGS